MSTESLSFITGSGMEYVAAGDSGERNRDRFHFYPPQSPLKHENYREILKSIVYSSILKRIFIRVENQYRLVDPVELAEIRLYPITQRRNEFNRIAAEMFWSEEVIIENAVPETVPQSLIEPKI